MSRRRPRTSDASPSRVVSSDEPSLVTRLITLTSNVVLLLSAGACGVFLLYFWFQYLVYAARDFEHWRRRLAASYRDLGAALQREKAQMLETFSSGEKERYYDEWRTRAAPYNESPLPEAGTLRVRVLAGCGESD